MRTEDLVPSLRKGVYISPSKKRVIFDFVGQIEFDQNKKLSLQEVPMSDSWVVQDLGLGMLTWAIEMVFSGSDADTKCQEMIQALSETGSGMLLHPSGTDILCIATGWRHQPSSLSSIRLARLSVNFIKTIKMPYPALQQDFEGEIELAKKDLLGPSKSLAEMINSFTQNELVDARRGLQNLVKTILTPLKWVADVSSSASGLLFQAELEFKKLLTLDASLDQLLQSVGNIVNAPANVDLGLADKFQGYQDAIDRITYPFSPNNKATSTMRWQVLQQVIVASYTSFENARLQSSDDISSFVAGNVINYQNILAHSPLPPDSIAQVLHMLNLSTQALGQLAISVPKKRSLVMQNDISPLALCYEISQAMGKTYSLENLLSENFLLAHEILLIPRGREVIYYG